ncbi:hypothetical protein [Pseudomonas sp.]|uniref:hypothetical protein n=1 Tax=Pseudomonas sp. TaxID=306 RepID=UPI0025806A02|nr:hypothetical protein [Pseudomonas sp.]
MFKLSVLVIDNRDLQRSNTVDALESLGVEHIHQASSEQESMAVLAEAVTPSGFCLPHKRRLIHLGFCS